MVENGIDITTTVVLYTENSTLLYSIVLCKLNFHPKPLFILIPIYTIVFNRRRRLSNVCEKCR